MIIADDIIIKSKQQYMLVRIAEWNKVQPSKVEQTFTTLPKLIFGQEDVETLRSLSSMKLIAVNEKEQVPTIQLTDEGFECYMSIKNTVIPNYLDIANKYLADYELQVANQNDVNLPPAERIKKFRQLLEEANHKYMNVERILFKLGYNTPKSKEDENEKALV